MSTSPPPAMEDVDEHVDDASKHDADEEEEEGDDEEEDDEDDEEEEDETPTIKVLPTRTTRGRRTKQVVDEEEAEADEQFYGQDAWKSEDEDEEVASNQFASSEVGDSSDSDIDLDETEEPDVLPTAGADEEDGLGKKKRGVYVDPARRRRIGIAKASSSPSKNTRSATLPPPRSMEVRTSTAKQAAETNKRVTEESQRKRQKRDVDKPKVPQTILTQRELLEAAAKTEVENIRSLKTTMFLEAEKKRLRAAEANRQKNKGPRVITKSVVSKSAKEEVTTVTFSDPATFPQPRYSNNVAQSTQHPICPITGQIAKYRDPASGIYFATMDAFKTLRARSIKT